MPSKMVSVTESHCMVPVVLLCVLCVAVSFSSLLYAISVRTDIEALSVRLEVLESRGGCDNSKPPSTNSHSASSSTSSISSWSEADTQLSPGSWSAKSDWEYWSKRNILTGETSPSETLPAETRESTIVTDPSLSQHQADEQGQSFSASNTKVRESETINESDHEIESDPRNPSVIKIRPERSPQTREFHNEDDVEEIPRGDRKPKGRRFGGGREDTVMRTGPRLTGGSQSLAIHFDGDASKYALGHRHYEGNGRLRHPDGLFKDWKMKDWGGRFERHFRLLETEGTLRIRESGLYFVYAQVHYLDDHDVNGFRILVNESPVLQCTVTSHGGANLKSNTCFTGGLVQLQTGDNLVIRDLAALRYSIFEAGKSFFGLFRITHLSTVSREGP